MPYLEIAVNTVGGQKNTFVYAADEPLAIGALVLVPFNTGRAQGIVLGPVAEPPDLEIRPILSVLERASVVFPAQIALARWIADRYCCGLIDALTLMLPPGMAQRPQTILTLCADVAWPPELSEGEFLVLEALRQNQRLTLRQIRAILAERHLARQGDRILRRLNQFGLIEREVLVRAPRVGVRLEWFIRRSRTRSETEEALAAIVRASRQRALLERLIPLEDRTLVPLALLRDEGHGDWSVIRALARQGLVTIEQREVRRDPLAHRAFPRFPLPALTPDQAAAGRAIEAALESGRAAAFLLYGVTGSGKTEVYLRAIAALLARGKRAIVLVPEITMTPQTLQRFAGRFPGRVAIVHSQLTQGERFDEWRRIRAGEADVIIGSRSALFAPVPNLGGIFVDEEHEWSYKQHDFPPRYHAREAALKLGELAGALVVLGSATPAIETFYRAQRGALTLLTLPRRIESALPPVEIVDLRTELREGNRSIFSTALRSAIETALGLREQVILFLNRRGDSTFVLCRDCGHVMHCRRCDTPFTYHADLDNLVCHLCNARAEIPQACPSCGGIHIRYFGVGTQKLESETRRTFPGARVLRWDRDSARARGAHDEMLRAFTNHEADVLIGTQMIAKGLDLPRVTLVGVISADASLHLPDFRSAERTFQLLTQVAGRAGRGRLGGRVIMQTYAPDHYSIISARNHDFSGFYAREIAFRQDHGYPPFGELARLLYVGNGENRVQQEVEQLAEQIRSLLRREAIDGIEAIGPAPAFHHKIRGRYRWQIILRGRNLSAFIRRLTLMPDWIVDVDPVNTL